MKQNTNIKLFIDTQGDPETGARPAMATVVIEDDFSYKTQEELDELKQRVGILYDDQGPATVKTELEFLMESQLKQLQNKEDAFKEFDAASGSGEDDTEKELQLHNQYRGATKNLGTMRRKVTIMRQEYAAMGVWYPESI